MSGWDNCGHELTLVDFGRWGDARAVAAKVLMNSALHQMLPRGHIMYVCPGCGMVQTGWSRLLRPRCPLDRVEMVAPELVRDNFKLLERLSDVLSVKLMLLEIVAKKYAGRPPDWWRLYFPPAVEAAFVDDPTVFRYAWWRNAAEAYLHRLDQERHYEVLTYLRRAVADYLFFELCIEINPQHVATAPPGAVYDEKRAVYKIVESRKSLYCQTLCTP